MAIHNLTTIQDSDVFNAYINESLANLGQRQGASGDKIDIRSFTINDIMDAVEDYINIHVSVDNGKLILDIKSSSDSPINFNRNSSEVIKTTITPIEYIGESSKSTAPVHFSDVQIFKHTDVNNYFLFKGILNINEIKTYIVVLQIPINEYNSNVDNTVNGILITDKFIIKYKNADVYGHTDSNLEEINSRINDSIKTAVSVDALYDNLKTGLTTVKNVNIDYFQNKFIYYFAVLPHYIVSLWNNNNILLNGETTLRQSIFTNLIETITKYALSNSIEDNFTENMIDDNYVIKISKDFEFKYFINSNSKEYLYSLDIPVLYTETPDNIDINANYIVAFSIYNKVSNFKFTVEYAAVAENETTEDAENKNITISSDKVYSLPYIGTIFETNKDGNIVYDENQIAVTKEVWFVNDVPTNVSPVGKDAGNPNIMLMVYDYDTTSNEINHSNNPVIDVKHTFVDDNVRNLKEIFTNIYPDNNVKLDLTYKFETNKANLTDQQTNALGNSEYTLFTYKLPIVSIDVLKQYKYIWEVIAKNTLVMLSIDSRFLTITNGENGFTSLHDVINFGTSTTSYITVFLHITKIVEDITNVEKYVWEIISNKQLGDENNQYNVSLDLGSMLGIQNLVNYYTNTKYEPDTYFFDHLVFKKIDSEIKQENVGNTQFIFPVFKVDNGTYYNSGDVNANDANFVPKFLLNNFVNFENEFSGNRITSVDDKPLNNGRLQELFAISTENKISSVLPSSSGDYIPANGQLSSNTRDYFKDIYPIFDFREVITNNQTGLNRISLMGVNSDSTVYHGYIGHDGSIQGDFDVLTIGSATTNWTLANNLTVTADYDNFAKYAKLRLDMPTEETKLLFNKYAEGKYFSIVTLDLDNNLFKDFVEEVKINEIKSPYLSDNIEIKIPVFNATKYINDYKHKEYANGGDDVKVRLQSNTEDDNNASYSGLNNNLVNIILYFEDYTPTNGESYLKKYKLVGAEEIIKNTNYKLNFNTSVNNVVTDEPAGE
jgi:hypothetical protein